MADNLVVHCWGQPFHGNMSEI